MRFENYILSALFVLFCTTAFSQNARIPFDYNRAELTETAKQDIRKLVEKQTGAEWIIEAGASSNGTETYNMELSQKRAQAIQNQLIKLGVDSLRIRISALGEKKANQMEDLAKDREAILYAVPSVVEEKQASSTRYMLSVWDAIDPKPIEGTYTYNKNTYAYKDSFGLAELNFPSIQISAEGYRDTIVQLSTKKMRYKIELMPKRVVEKLVFGNIYFYPNTADFLPESIRALEDLYRKLKGREDIQVQIRGHVNWPMYMENSEDLERAHQLLSEQRALAVVQWLSKRGIARQILSYKGFGSTQMTYPNASTEGQQAANRRVEVIVLAK